MRKTAEPGLRWDVGSQVSIRVLAGMGDTYGSANDIDLNPWTRDLDENCGSIALLVRLGQFEFYTAGDQTSDDWRRFQDTEMAVVGSAAFGSNRDIDVFKVNHHGSESSNGPRFLHALDQLVTITSSRPGPHQTPKAITVQELLRNGAVVYITGDALDENGRFPSSNHTTRDDGFTPFPADSVIKRRPGRGDLYGAGRSELPGGDGAGIGGVLGRGCGESAFVFVCGGGVSGGGGVGTVGGGVGEV